MHAAAAAAAAAAAPCDRHRVSADLLVSANLAERIKISHRNIDVFWKSSQDELGTLRPELMLVFGHGE